MKHYRGGKYSAFDAGILLSPGIHARQQAETGRSAGGRSGISVGKLHALSGKAVNVGDVYKRQAVVKAVGSVVVVSWSCA